MLAVLRVSALLFLAVGLSTRVRAQPVFVPVALTGQVAPGAADGAEFDSFGFATAPAINNAGDVAFGAVLRTGGSAGAGVVDSLNDTALLGPTSGSGSVLGVLAREGGALPGAGDLAEINGFTRPLLNNVGSVVFSSSLRTGAAAGAGPVDLSNNSALLGRLGGGSSTVTLGREGEPAPGLNPGAFFGGFGVPASINDSDNIVLVNSVNQSFGAIFAITSTPAGTTTSLFAIEGQTAPPAISGFVFNELSPRGPVLNNSNSIALRATLLEPDGELIDSVLGPPNGAGSGITTLVIGFSGAGLPPGGVAFGAFDRPVLNDAGQLAFRGTLQTTSGPQSAIISQLNGPGSAFGAVVAAGQALPGVAGGAVPGSFGEPALNDGGDIALVAELFTPIPTGGFLPAGDGVFGPTNGAGSDFGQIAQTGDQAPIGNFGELDFSELSTPALNNAGDLVFEATLISNNVPGAPPLNSMNNEGLFAYVDGGLVTVVREGDLIDFAPPGSATTEQRTVAGIGFNTDPFDRSNGLSDTGLVVVALTFTDGTEGVFTVDLANLVDDPVLFGDFNDDGVVNAADYTVARDLIGQSVTLPNDPTPGAVDLSDLQVFVENFGRESADLASLGLATSSVAVPEPTGLLLMLAASGLAGQRRRC